MARPADPHARSALIAAARKEFVGSGIQKARIEDITHACGLSKGAFYLHFESKEALFGELVSTLEQSFDAHRKSREQAYATLTAGRRRVVAADVEALAAIEVVEDRKLLELLWEWRDVTHVLLAGSQGTVFDGVMWKMLDREVARVELEFAALKQARLIRDDLPADVLGLMVVGTYLLVTRKLTTLPARPDFDHWVQALHKLIAHATRPQLMPVVARSPSPPRTRRRATAAATRRTP